MGKITNFKIIDKKTIELLSDAKKGDQIDLSIKQSIDFSNLDEQIRNEQSFLLKKELEQQENTLNAQIAELKDNLLTATLVDDTEQIESIKAQYQTLVGGE